jgi:transposase-like protein
MTKTTESKWRALIAAQGKSGLSVREFAGLHGLSPATLYWWRSKLRRDRTLLVPVEVIEEPDLDNAGARGRRVDSFELRIDDAMTLRIPSGFDECDLRRLIRSLRC